VKPEESVLDGELNPRPSQYSAPANKDDEVEDVLREIVAQPERCEIRETLRKEQTIPLLHQEETKSHASKYLKPQLGKCLYQASHISCSWDRTKPSASCNSLAGNPKFRAISTVGSSQNSASPSA
jgi:hypothetical protein